MSSARTGAKLAGALLAIVFGGLLVTTLVLVNKLDNVPFEMRVATNVACAMGVVADGWMVRQLARDRTRDAPDTFLVTWLTVVIVGGAFALVAAERLATCTNPRTAPAEIIVVSALFATEIVLFFILDRVRWALLERYRVLAEGPATVPMRTDTVELAERIVDASAHDD